MMIPRSTRELLEQVLEEFDDAKSCGLVMFSGLETHPSKADTTCASIRFAPKVEAMAVQRAISVTRTKYSNTAVLCNVTQVGVALSKKFFFWFDVIPER